MRPAAETLLLLLPLMACCLLRPGILCLASSCTPGNFADRKVCIGLSLGPARSREVGAQFYKWRSLHTLGSCRLSTGVCLRATRLSYVCKEASCSAHRLWKV